MFVHFRNLTVCHTLQLCKTGFEFASGILLQNLGFYLHNLLLVHRAS